MNNKIAPKYVHYVVLLKLISHITDIMLFSLAYANNHIAPKGD